MFDAASLMLLLVVLLPGRWIAYALRHRKEWRLTQLAVVVISATAILRHGFPPTPGRIEVPFIVLTVASTALWLLAEAVWHWNDRPGALDTAAFWGTAALVWTLPALDAVRPHSDAHASPWLIDVFNKLFFGAIVPILDRLHLGAGTGAALARLTTALVFLSHNIVGIAFGGSLALVALVYELLRGKVPELAPCLARVEGRVPRPFALLWPIGTAGVLWMGMNPVWLLCSQIGLAACVLSGAWTLYTLSTGTRTLRTAFWAMGAVHLIIPELLWVPCAIGFLNAFLGFTTFARLYTRTQEVVAARVEQWLASVRMLVRPASVVAGLALLHIPRMYFMDDVWQGGIAEPAGATQLPPAPAPDMVRVVHGDTAFDIDRYEFPNRVGEPPLTDRAPRQAITACAAAGKHLCTRDEWAWACSNGSKDRYIFAEPTEDESINRVLRECHPEGEPRLAASGELAGCVNALGIHDLPGNAFEWVAMPGRQRTYGLMGGAYEYFDDLTLSCPFVVVVHEQQVPILDLELTGFRCCR